MIDEKNKKEINKNEINMNNSVGKLVNLDDSHNKLILNSKIINNFEYNITD